jgi:hypothetical protein
MNETTIPEFDRNNWPLPNEFLLELGRIAAMWAYLESSLDIAISKFAGAEGVLDMKHLILIKHSSFPQKLDMLASLCEYLLPSFPQLKIYPDTLVELRKAQKSRNRYLHNGMSFNKETGNVEMGIASARGKLKTAIEIVTIDDLKLVPVELNSASRNLHYLVTGKQIPPIWEIRKGT